MKRASIIRSLRIAWSVWCGIGCLLLMALWVRSYQKLDAISFVNQWNHFASFGSNSGTLYFHLWGRSPFKYSRGQWFRYSGDATEPPKAFNWQANDSPALVGGSIYVPHWFPALVIAMFSAAPWLRSRFQPPHSANRHDAGRGGAGDCGIFARVVGSRRSVPPIRECGRRQHRYTEATHGQIMYMYIRTVIG